MYVACMCVCPTEVSDIYEQLRDPYSCTVLCFSVRTQRMAYNRIRNRTHTHSTFCATHARAQCSGIRRVYGTTIFAEHMLHAASGACVASDVCNAATGRLLGETNNNNSSMCISINSRYQSIMCTHRSGPWLNALISVSCTLTHTHRCRIESRQFGSSSHISSNRSHLSRSRLNRCLVTEAHFAHNFSLHSMHLRCV